jgi:AcrR family transcriptional regulator
MSGTNGTKATTKGRRTAEELQAAALRVIARNGYLATKITDITAEAGKAAGSFYRYFTDKDALLRAVAKDYMAALSARVSDELGTEHTFRNREDVRLHVLAYWANYREHRAEMTGIYEASLVSSEFARYWSDLRGRHTVIWARHIAEARQLAAPDEEAELTAFAVVCMLERFCQAAPTLPPTADDDAVVDALTHLIADGILPQRRPDAHVSGASD